MLADHIEQVIAATVLNTLKYGGINMLDSEYIATDSLAEVIEKLCILHIRTWHLEDAMQSAKSDAEIADIKRKLDICFKVKRPRFVEAINRMVNDAIVLNRSLAENSVKLYKGLDNVQNSSV